MKAKVMIAIIVGVLLGGGVLAWVRNRDRMPDGLTVVNGRIEGDPVVVAAKVLGRLVTLLVKEGEVVEIGQPRWQICLAENIQAKFSSYCLRNVFGMNLVP